MSEGPRPFAVASSRVVTPHEVRPAAVLIDGGRIEAVVRREDVPAGVPVEDFGDLVISPGIVDSHVHINEPGRTEWEGFETATRAAAAGGVTTLVDMPLNSSPVTTTVAALRAKRQAAEGKCWVDVGYYGGLVPGNLEQIEPLVDEGVCGVKAFMCDSGLAEFPASNRSELTAAASLLGRRDVPLLVHAEAVAHEAPQATPTSLSTWVESRPEAWEFEAIRLLRQVAEETQAHIHVVHVSSRSGAALVKLAQEHGHRLTAETCPHYLYFAEEHFAAANTLFKCAPPLRGRRHRYALHRALLAGTISTIGSDHSPCPPDLKCIDDGDWRRAWGGISSLELTLAVVWQAMWRRAIPFTRLAEWLSRNPARLCGLPGKGRLVAGCDADLCIWDPEEEWTVVGAKLQHRHKLTPYEGQRVCGQVKRTYVRGRLVYDEDKFPAGPIGELLKRYT